MLMLTCGKAGCILGAGGACGVFSEGSRFLM